MRDVIATPHERGVDELRPTHLTFGSYGYRLRGKFHERQKCAFLRNKCFW